MTLKGHPEAESIHLVRSSKDIAWLIDNLATSGKCPLLPRHDYEDTFSHLLNMISSSHPVRTKKLKVLKEKVLLRCLTLLSTIVLEHLRGVGEQYQLPLFIFFH